MKKIKLRQTAVNRDLIREVPYILTVMICLFLIGSLVGGELLGAYTKYWWWDDVLHGLSGVIVGLIGFYMVYFLNARYNMKISPLFVAVFAFSFAMTMGVLWEIFEFSADYFLGANMQRWMQPDMAHLIGKDYQGYGLRDTMSDLIISVFGAILASVFAYLSYKHEREAVIKAMRRPFHRHGRG